MAPARRLFKRTNSTCATRLRDTMQILLQILLLFVVHKRLRFRKSRVTHANGF